MWIKEKSEMKKEKIQWPKPHFFMMIILLLLQIAWNSLLVQQLNHLKKSSKNKMFQKVLIKSHIFFLLKWESKPQKRVNEQT